MKLIEPIYDLISDRSSLAAQVRSRLQESDVVPADVRQKLLGYSALKLPCIMVEDPVIPKATILTYICLASDLTGVVSNHTVQISFIVESTEYFHPPADDNPKSRYNISLYNDGPYAVPLIDDIIGFLGTLSGLAK